ncbi:hexokinase-3 isoform X2 [Sminthopsis crassicaudata]|uniref:hexokinase-3 isoform X2 n=1 Tax=Sminthopsis crassicaudata TaxID=9301 RepID=UPI003D687816
MKENTLELVQQCLNRFDVTEEQLQQIQAGILWDMEQALRRQAGSSPSVQMLPTYVRSTPHGTEQGDFLVLELGALGATLRVLWVTLTGSSGPRKEPVSQEFTIPTEITLGTGPQLFDFAAGCLVQFLDQLQVGSQPIQLGFNFSFPCHQTGLNQSTLISWTKGFRCSGVEGQDVVQLLREAIQRQGAYSIDVIAVVNDTVGTMMSCDPAPQACEVGLVVDMGTNACYMEEVQHVVELREDRGRVCVNVQWGSFGDSGALEPVQTPFDLQLDQESLDPGTQSPSHGRARAQAMLQGLGLKPSAQDCAQVQQVCGAVSSRAARLCAAALTAVLARVRSNRERSPLGIFVATGGRVYEQHPRFSALLQQTVRLLAPDADVTFVPSEDGGGRGVAVVTAVAARLALQRRQLEETLAPFWLCSEQLKAVQAQMRESMARGLRGEDSSVRMLPTYVCAMPDGTERGDFLALDLGGTNFRVLWVKVGSRSEGGVKITNRVFSLPESVTQGTGQQLFDHIVDCIVDFQKENNLSGQTLPLSFTFSFPCRQLGLDQGILLNWTKGFKATDCEGQDVVSLLRAAIRRRQGVELNVVAIVNDTVGTMMSCGYEDPHCEVGLIVGTGTNACYMEELSNVSAVPGDGGRMCINMEWGAFGDDGAALQEFYTPFDISVDQASINPGKQRYEKLISGMYLGEIVRQVLLHLTRLGVLFCGQVFPRLQTKDIIKTKFLSEIESDLERWQVRAILEKLGLPANCEDALLVREVCQAVSRRAAKLCGAGVAAVVEKIRENRGLAALSVTVGVDGTLYKLHPHFSEQVKDTVRQLAPRCSVRFLPSEDGSGKGAALVTAVACRLARAAQS